VTYAIRFASSATDLPETRSHRASFFHTTYEYAMKRGEAYKSDLRIVNKIYLTPHRPAARESFRDEASAAKRLNF
jgi:hypothetical protein